MASVASFQVAGYRLGGIKASNGGRPPADHGVESIKGESGQPNKIPFQQWTERVGNAVDVLKHRVNVTMDPKSGKPVLESRAELVDLVGTSHFGDFTVNSVSPPGDYLEGAPFHNVG